MPNPHELQLLIEFTRTTNFEYIKLIQFRHTHFHSKMYYTPAVATTIQTFVNVYLLKILLAFSIFVSLFKRFYGSWIIQLSPSKKKRIKKYFLLFAKACMLKSWCLNAWGYFIFFCIKSIYFIFMECEKILSDIFKNELYIYIFAYICIFLFNFYFSQSIWWKYEKNW